MRIESYDNCRQGGAFDHRIFLLLMREGMDMLTSKWGEQIMSIFEGETKFIEAGRFDRTFFKLPETLLNPEYKDLAESFRATFGRIVSFFELPLQLIYWSGKIAQIRLVARSRCGVSPEDASKDGTAAVQATMAIVLAEVAAKGGKSLELGDDALSGML